MPIGDGKLVGEVIGARFPMARKLLEKLGPAVIDAIQQQPAGRPINEVVNAAAPIIERAIAADPTIKNDNSLEHWWQSRVIWGQMINGVALIVGPLGLVLTSEQQQAIVLLIWGILQGGGMFLTVFGRLKSGLMPLFSRKKPA